MSCSSRLTPQGRIPSADLDGLPFELWFDGVMLLYGSTETDEDLDIDEGQVQHQSSCRAMVIPARLTGCSTDVPLLDKLGTSGIVPIGEVIIILTMSAKLRKYSWTSQYSTLERVRDPSLGPSNPCQEEGCTQEQGKAPTVLAGPTG